MNRNNTDEKESRSAPEYIGLRLGREYPLSIAEIFSLIQANNLTLPLYDCTENILIVTNTHKMKEVPCLKKSGGTIKIFELPFLYRGSTSKRVFHSWLSSLDLLNNYLRNTLYSEKKFVFGISSYPLSDFEGDVNDLQEYNEFLGSFLKNKFKEYGFSPGFLGVAARRMLPELSSAEIAKKNLLKKSFELVFCIGKDKILLGKTVWIQDYKKFEKRDISRPKRMPEIMTPTKLSLMLLNLSLKSNSKRFLDPFCGTGTILQEALLKGLTIYGSDINPRCVEATKENLQWLIKEFHLDTPLLNIFQCDARNLSTRIEKKSIDAVATEPYLGPPVRGSPSLSTVHDLVNDLRQFYTQSLKELKKILKDDGKIVMTFPVYRIKNQKIFMPVEDILDNEFKIISSESLAHCFKILRYKKRNTLLYYRENQKVGREIVTLEKRRRN